MIQVLASSKGWYLSFSRSAFGRCISLFLPFFFLLKRKGKERFQILGLTIQDLGHLQTHGSSVWRCLPFPFTTCWVSLFCVYYQHVEGKRRITAGDYFSNYSLPAVIKGKERNDFQMKRKRKSFLTAGKTWPARK